MRTQVRTLDFSGQIIYVGIDVHRKSWKITVYLKETAHKTFNMSPPSVEQLALYLRKNYPNGTYKCAYEAGFCGFWIQEGLTTFGIETIVIHASDVPTTDKEKQQKNDVRDSNKIARSLRNGELHGIYIPSKQLQFDRSQVRYRWTLASDRKSVMNRIKGYLHYYGFHPSQGVLQEWRWTGEFITWLNDLAKNNETLWLYLMQYNALRKVEKEGLKQLRIMFNQERYKTMMKLLCTVPGIGFLSAAMILTEIVDMNRFKTFDQLAFFIGLVPKTDSSGETERAKTRTTRGHQRLRTMLIESSWSAIRTDAELACYYAACKNRMDGPHAIIKVARKLLNRIRRVMLTGEPYIFAEK